MHISFTKHNPDISQSCKAVTEYLEKENSFREKEFENFMDEFESQKLSDFDKQIEKQNLFFTTDEIDDEKYLDQNTATDLIDDNISSRAKENESKFFILNISPSKDELEHLNQIIDLELKSNGFNRKEIDILNQTVKGEQQLELIKNDLMHQCLREYAKEVMKEYADNFNRDVYSNPDQLPNRREEVQINSETKNELERLGINRKDPEYAERFQMIREVKAAEFGKDLSVRKMTDRDLVWVAKVEEQRTYKANDKWVSDNRKINREIKLLESENGNNSGKVDELRSQLHKDRNTGEIVREGLKKGGQQYHIHVIVSRYDNCPNARYKGSISPLANHRNSKVAGKSAQVGFNRDQFFKKVEQSFDQKFRYDRTQSYQRFNEQKKIRTGKTVRLENLGKGFSSAITKPIKNELYRNSGLYELQKLNLNSTISKELGFRVPLSIPKTPLEIAVKTIKSVITKITDVSKGY